MNHDFANEFTDWCYNNFVSSQKNYRPQYADIYLDVLKKHFQWNLNGSQLNEQRLRAYALLEAINAATENNELETLRFAKQQIKD